MKEDDSRELYTLDIAKTDPIKIPVFEGRDDEDFAIFKEKVIKAFAQNRICKDDKVAKLREALRGHAKKLIPKSRITDIDDAWKALDIAFGDPTRLLRSKMEKLFKLGMLPKENAKGGLKAQVEWYLEYEAMLKSIIDLGSKDEELNMLTFNKNTIADIVKMFPPIIMKKLIKIPGTGRLRLENIAEKVSELRIDAQEHLNFVGIGSNPVTSAAVGGGSQIEKDTL